jgi:O-antigen ligase
MSLTAEIKKNITTVNPLEAIFFIGMIGLTGWLLKGQHYLLAPLPALGIVFLLILIRYPQFGYYLIIFFIPFDAIMGALGIAEFLTISKFVGIWLVIYVIFRTFIDRASPFDLKSNLWPLLFYFFIVNLISAATSDYTLLSFDNIRQLFTAYLFYTLTLVFVNEKGFRTTLPTLVTVCVTLNAVLSVIGFIFLLPVLSSKSDILRATGFSGDPNFFASMSLFVLPLIACQIKTNEKPTLRLFFIAAFFIAISAVVLSFSRSAARVLIFVLCLLAFEHLRNLKPKHLGFISIVIAVSIVLAFLIIPKTYWDRQQVMTDSSIGRRITYTYVAWDIFKEHPLLGVGPGAFKEVYARSQYAAQFAEELLTDLTVTKKHRFSAKARQRISNLINKNYDQVYVRYAHNTYLEVVSGSGGIGLFVFFAILFVSTKNYLKAVSIFKAKGDEQTASLTKAYLISQIALMVSFMFLSNLYHKFLWLPLALSHISLKFAEQKAEAKDEAVG